MSLEHEIKASIGLWCGSSTGMYLQVRWIERRISDHVDGGGTEFTERINFFFQVLTKLYPSSICVGSLIECLFNLYPIQPDL